MSTNTTLTDHLPAPGTRRPAGHGGELRLTRRGRVVIVALLLAVLMAGVMAMGGYSAASDARGSSQPTRTVVVGEGDTLWGIAAGIAEPGEVRETVHELQELNTMSGPELFEGQRIAVPTR